MPRSGEGVAGGRGRRWDWNRGGKEGRGVEKFRARVSVKMLSW